MFFVLVTILTAGAAFFIGTRVSEPEVEAGIVIVPEPVIEEVIVYKERIVYEPQFIFEEVPVYEKQIEYVEVSVQLKPFRSWKELGVWLANNYVKDAVPDRCVDTALELNRRAWQDGYQMSTELWGDGKREGHMINSTVIGDEIYFIEPSSAMSWLGGVKKSVTGK